MFHKGDLVQVYLGPHGGTYEISWSDLYQYRSVVVGNGDLVILLENVIPLEDYPGEEQVHAYIHKDQEKVFIPVEILKRV